MDSSKYEFKRTVILTGASESITVTENEGLEEKLKLKRNRIAQWLFALISKCRC